MRPEVVARVADVVALYLEQDELARAEWARRHDWATLDEIRAGMDEVLAPLKALIADHHAARQADLEADDFRAFVAAHEWPS
jgi:hypothetical protein